MKSIAFLLVAGLANLSWCTLAMSETAATPDAVYFINMQKVIDDSILGKAARSDVEAEAKKRQIALDVKKSELGKLKEDFEKQRALLSPSALSDRQQSIEKKERDLMHDFEDQKEALEKKNSHEMKKVVDQIDAAVKELAEKNNYRMVIERDPRMVLYADPKWDLTEEIVKHLNEKKLGL